MFLLRILLVYATIYNYIYTYLRFKNIEVVDMPHPPVKKK